MDSFISKKELFKRALIMTSIFFALGIGLYIFDLNYGFLKNFQFYYAKAYIDATNYTLNNGLKSAKNNLALIINITKNNILEQNNNSNVLQTNVLQTDLAKSIPVLLYHGIIEKDDGYNILYENFKEQMFALKQNGWQAISIEDFYNFIQGKKQLPDKSFLLTFDDGRKDSFYPVDPILKTLNYRATIFIITDRSLGKNNEKQNFHLSKNELEKMRESGRWDIQVHTKKGHYLYKIDPNGMQGHFYSNKLWLDDKNRFETDEEFIERVTNDIISAKNDIEQNLGINVISFAYPMGDFGQNSINFPETEYIFPNIVKSIYPISFYQVWPGKGFSFNYPDSNQFLFKRIDVKPEWTANDLLKILNTAKEKSLPYLDDFEDNNGWIKTWGGFSLKNNSMILGSDASTTGGEIFLDGSYSWRNYIFESKINWIKGNSVSLMARYKDDENYTACDFSDDDVRIEQRLNKRNRVMVKIEKVFNFPKTGAKLGIRVNNDKVECLIDNRVVAYTYYLSPILSNGGIGFKTWDPQVNNSEIIIKEISVKEIQ